MKRQILIFVALLAWICLPAQQNKVEKSFDGGPGTVLKVQNSFGDINVDTHSGTKIKIEVTITVEPKNGKDVEDYLKDIRIDAQESGKTVSVKTINEMKGGNKVKSFSIDYDIKVPSGTEVNIRNTFGDVKVHGTGGVLDLNVQHGDCFIASALQQKGRRHSVFVQFGDLRIEEIEDAEINVQHGDFDIDRFKKGEVRLQFGDGSIDRLDGDTDLRISHSELDIREVLPSLEGMDVELQFSELNLGAVRNGDFTLDLEGSFTDFSWDGNYTIDKREKGMNSNSYIMFTGKERSAKQIRIRGSHSDVDFK